MSEFRSDTLLNERIQKSLTNRAHAQDLCVQALETANELFDNGDLSPFLSILSRLHWYNFYNLLLILKQYPSATHLSSFQAWQNRIGDRNKRVLKRDQFGKGIELVAAATYPYPQGTRSLYWDCLKQFDITQTTIQGYKPSQSIYLSGVHHTRELIKALRNVLRGDYDMAVLTDQSTTSYRSGNAGYMEGNTVHCRPDLSDTELVLWLSESLLSLGHPTVVTGEKYHRMFLRMSQHCLLRIWGFEDPRLLYLPQDKELISSMPTHLRPVFLDLLQRRVRHIEEVIYRRYQAQLLDREEEVHSEPLLTFRTSGYEKEIAEHEDSPSGLE